MRQEAKMRVNQSKTLLISMNGDGVFYMCVDALDGFKGERNEDTVHQQTNSKAVVRSGVPVQLLQHEAHGQM